LTNGPL
jgi:hypothetical protein